MSDIKKYIYSHKDEMIKLLSDLVSIPSVQDKPVLNCPFGTEPARALETMLFNCKSYGFFIDTVDNYAGSAELYDSPPALAILTHLDVVPAGSGWNTDPFTLNQNGNKLVGRGTIDDKGPAVASVFALRAIKELGIPLKHNVRLIFGTNEENGSADLEYYRKKRKLPSMVFTPDGEFPVINVEKGMLRILFSADYDGISVNGGSVINAVPSVCIYGNETFSGKSAHASTPEKGENAITKFLSQNKSSHPLFSELAKLFPFGETNGQSCGLGFSDNISGMMTCVLSILKSNEGRLNGGIDIRFPINRSKAEISDIVCNLLLKSGFDIDSCDGVEPHCTDSNSEFVQALLRVYERVTGNKGTCIAIGGGTYVHEIDGGVAFGAEFPGTDYNMHSPDEFIFIDDFLKLTELIVEAIIELCS